MSKADYIEPGEISFADLIKKIRSARKYIYSKWLTIVIMSAIGALLGLCYSIFKKPLYIAVCTFVLDESKGGMGQYSDLASLAGFSLGSNNGSLFQGDNILALYTSRLMIEKALLSTAAFNNKKMLLINRYISSKDLRTKWRNHDNINYINFNGNPSTFDRKQDSLISEMVIEFNKKYLSVTKPDKKLSIIRVEFICTDELFAKEFTDKLVENVNSFYIETKTKKTYQNVQLLQKQADSVKMVLNSSLGGVASAIDATPNANPLLLSLRVPSQKKQVDVQAATAIYSEIVKNLEVSKISLRQETPLIQVIDKPVLPLYIEKLGKIAGFIIGLIIAPVITITILVFRRVYHQLIA